MQILGNNECFEPYTSNIYVRRVLSGEFTVVNQHLLQDLTKLKLWNPDLKNELVASNGSVQACPLAFLTIFEKVVCFWLHLCRLLSCSRGHCLLIKARASKQSTLTVDKSLANHVPHELALLEIAPSMSPAPSPPSLNLLDLDCTSADCS